MDLKKKTQDLLFGVTRIYAHTLSLSFYDRHEIVQKKPICKLWYGESVERKVWKNMFLKSGKKFSS